MSQDPSEPAFGQQKTSRFPVRELIVDFLGSLVPGFGFIVALVPCLLVPTAALFYAISGGEQDRHSWGRILTEVLPSLHFEILGAGFVVSYIIGSVFCRQDPKWPDQVSFSRVPEEDKAKSPVRPSTDGSQKVEFPYSHLHEYLTDRGMAHLANIVPWRGADSNSIKLRSKHFINALKIRLEFAFPERFGTIARNEAHIRLMSSGWYFNRALKKFASFGLVLGITSNIAHALVVQQWLRLPYLWVVAGPVLVWYGAHKMMEHIEKAFFYQRVREIVFVLETAYWAERQSKGFLRGLDHHDSIIN